MGGLITASAMVLLYIAFDTRTVRQIIPVDFRLLGASGVLIALLTGAFPLLLGESFLTHQSITVYLPLIGKTHLATALLFDIGVFFTVVGTTMTIITSISEDE